METAENKNYNKKNTGEDDCSEYGPQDIVADIEDSEERSLFDPPLYHQRYMFAVQHLSHHQVKTVADLGCSDCSFFKILSTVTSLEKVALVDIDHDLLESKKRAINPELRHFVHRREEPMTVSLYSGSAGQFDSRLGDFEAVTMIEVIEHLYPDILDQVTTNVFGNIHPRICIVTTPNSEFNVLFGNDDPKEFRHWDHKFEWTRQEFQQWCSGVCEKFDYSVEHSGVGYPFTDPDSLMLGPCSQAAIFTAYNQESSVPRTTQIPTETHCYTLISSCEFPYYKDERSLEEKIDDQIQYCLNTMMSSRKQEVDYGDEMTIPVDSLANFPSIKKLCGVDAVRSSLIRVGYKLSDDKETIIIPEEDHSEDWSDHDPDLYSEQDEDILTEESDSISKETISTPNSSELSTNPLSKSSSDKSGCHNVSQDKITEAPSASENWDLDIQTEYAVT